LKITILQGAFLPVPPAMGGAVEKMWFALGKDFAQRGHEVVHISREFQDMPKMEWIDGVLHKRVSGYTTPSSGLYLKGLDLLYSLRAKSIVPRDSDIVVTNAFWAPIVLSSKLRKKCMVDVQRMPKGQMRFYRTVSRLRANSSSVAVAIKEEIAPKQHNRVVMIPNPLPFKGVLEVDLTIKKPIILYAGRVHPEKGLELLIKAFKLVEAGWILKIVGPWETEAGGGGGSYFEQLKRLAGEGAINFLGPVYDMNELNKIYAEASIFVYPSIAEKGETFGLAPLEAMAWGSAPIVSNLSCFQDFIRHEQNGLIFDHRAVHAIGQLKTAIEALIKDKVFWSGLAQKALLVSQSHSISSVGSQFIEEFKRMDLNWRSDKIDI